MELEKKIDTECVRERDEKDKERESTKSLILEILMREGEKRKKEKLRKR